MSENKFLESKILHFKDLFPIDVLRIIHEFASESKIPYELKRELRGKVVELYGFDKLYKLGYRDFSHMDYNKKYVRDTCLWKCNFEESSLCGTTFSSTELTGCNFKKTELSGIYFRNCTLMHSIFSNSNMYGCMMNDCHAFYAIFTCCNMNKSTIKDSNFENAIITSCRLKGTLFKNCHMDIMDFFGCNTSNTLFIDT